MNLDKLRNTLRTTLIDIWEYVIPIWKISGLFKRIKSKKDLENFNEIENFSFYLNWSGILQIEIDETEPFMIWIRDKNINYIDFDFVLRHKHYNKYL